MNYNVNRKLHIWIHLTFTDGRKLRINVDEIQSYYEHDSICIINTERSCFTVKETIKEIDDLLTKVTV